MHQFRGCSVVRFQNPLSALGPTKLANLELKLKLNLRRGWAFTSYRARGSGPLDAAAGDPAVDLDRWIRPHHSFPALGR
jgi:hypothetical protein